MKNIAIYLCGNVAKRCTANGCLRVFNNKEDSFEEYENEDCKLVAVNTCNGCDESPIESLELKIEKLKKAEVDVIHLSSCIRGRCEHYEEFAKVFSQHFDVVGYTHGSKEGRQNNSISIKKNI